jgi:hypothetical protein
VNSRARLRDQLFTTGISFLVLNVLFYGLWQKVAARFTPCNGKALGIEVGLAVALHAFVFAMFGYGAKRLLAGVVALIAIYFWFSWIAWIGQMQC